eukprot:3581269-Rhodomonas_salina.1
MKAHAQQQLVLTYAESLQGEGRSPFPISQSPPSDPPSPPSAPPSPPSVCAASDSPFGVHPAV